MQDVGRKVTWHFFIFYSVSRSFQADKPQHDAGIRIEPAPSLACAIGTTPEATIAALPPDEPPVE